MRYFLWVMGILGWLAAVNFGYPIVKLLIEITPHSEVDRATVLLLPALVPTTLLAVGFAIVGTLFIGFGSVIEAIHPSKEPQPGDF
jgi:amino acid transporter